MTPKKKAATSIKPPRQRKTAHQRAQEALDVSTRKLTRLEKTLGALRQDIAQAEQERDAEELRHEYLGKHPDLQQPATTNTKEA